jgi:calcium-dependent protein kinase
MLIAFLQEVRIHSVLNHKNVVRLFDSFEDDDFLYIVMELYDTRARAHTQRLTLCSVEGGELFDELLSRERFTEDDAAKVCHCAMRARV